MMLSIYPRLAIVKLDEALFEIWLVWHSSI